MAPSEPTERTSASAVDAEPALELKYEKVYASERKEALAEDPLEGYEKVPVGEGITDEDEFKRLAESLIGPSQVYATVLWNPESGAVRVNYERFAEPGRHRGFLQREAGYVRYVAEYLDVSYRRPFKKVEEDHRQGWEVGRVEQCDEISEAIPSDHPDHDPELSAEVERAIQSALLDSLNSYTVGMDSEDWMVTNGPNTNLLFREFNPDQRWVAFRTRRSGRSLEKMAQRIGLNCRVYRSEANLLAHGYHGNYHDVWPDKEMLLVPVGVKIG